MREKLQKRWISLTTASASPTMRWISSLQTRGAWTAAHYCFDHTSFDGIVIPTLRRAVSRTPKGAVLSGPTGVLLQIRDIKVIPNAPKEKTNDRSRTTVRC